MLSLILSKHRITQHSTQSLLTKVCQKTIYHCAFEKYRTLLCAKSQNGRTFVSLCRPLRRSVRFDRMDSSSFGFTLVPSFNMNLSCKFLQSGSISAWTRVWISERKKFLKISLFMKRNFSIILWIRDQDSVWEIPPINHNSLRNSITLSCSKEPSKHILIGLN